MYNINSSHYEPTIAIVIIVLVVFITIKTHLRRPAFPQQLSPTSWTRPLARATTESLLTKICIFPHGFHLAWRDDCSLTPAPSCA